MLGNPCAVPLPLSDGFQGHVFWAQGEIRWLRLGSGTVRVVYTGDSPMNAGSLTSRQLEASSDDVCYVVGAGHAVDFSAVPPVSTGDVLCVIVRRYRADKEGVFERFSGLVVKPVTALVVVQGGGDAQE
ncbi:MAG: hypothetical protein HY897_09050 [Deltaproteobacteria bacterium]|nr:hypothetical protein [Deltaproteobacteria bacterium]